MIINCKESAVRSSEMRDHSLKGIRKLELWYHLLMCKLCRIYGRQIKKLGRLSRLIGQTSGDLPTRDDEPACLKLSESAKARLKKNLQA